MSNLFGVPLLLALVAFVLGWVAAKFAAYVGARAANLEIPTHDRTIRSLEADLRIARKDAFEATEKLSESTQTLDKMRMSADEMEQTIQYNQEELGTMRKAVKSESKKVVGLRRELTDRAEETIRANVVARDSETELSVLKAGAEAIFNDINSIEAEREELTNRLKALDERFIDESGFDRNEAEQKETDLKEAGQKETTESAQDDTPLDEYLSDC